MPPKGEPDPPAWVRRRGRRDRLGMETRFAERLTPLAAAATALAAFACCVPLGFAGALGVLALGSLFDALQPWFLTHRDAAAGAERVQFYRGRSTCRLAAQPLQPRRSSVCRRRSSCSCCSSRKAWPAGSRTTSCDTRYLALAGDRLLVLCSRASGWQPAARRPPGSRRSPICHARRALQSRVQP